MFGEESSPIPLLISNQARRIVMNWLISRIPVKATQTGQTVIHIIFAMHIIMWSVKPCNELPQPDGLWLHISGDPTVGYHPRCFCLTWNQQPTFNSAIF